ncbi:MAG: HIT domain-containing protein, partial [Marinobacter sp.]
WVLLVPRRPGIRELYQLAPSDQQQLLAESSLLGEGMMAAFRGDKLNLAALGNMVTQLHLHHIVRHEGDTGWPGPVWGLQAPVPYTGEQLEACRARLAPVIGRLTAG